MQYEELAINLPKFVAQWTLKDVQVWLTYIQMAAVYPNFISCAIDGSCLKVLDQIDLIQQLNIKSKYSLKKLMQWISAKFNQYDQFLESMFRQKDRIEKRQKCYQPESLTKGSVNKANQGSTENLELIIHEQQKSFCYMVSQYPFKMGSSPEYQIKIGNQQEDNAYSLSLNKNKKGFYLLDYLGNCFIHEEQKFSSLLSPFLNSSSIFYPLQQTFFRIRNKQFRVNFLMTHRKEGSKNSLQLSVLNEGMGHERGIIIEDEAIMLIQEKSNRQIGLILPWESKNKQKQFFLLCKKQQLWFPMQAQLQYSASIGTKFMIDNQVFSIQPLDQPTVSQDEEQCFICCSNPRDSIILHCGHHVTCTRCAWSLENCPICRRPISEVKKVNRTKS